MLVISTFTLYEISCIGIIHAKIWTRNNNNDEAKNLAANMYRYVHDGEHTSMDSDRCPPRTAGSYRQQLPRIAHIHC